MKTSTLSKRSHTKSESLWEKAKRLIPGGVNSPVRSFKEVGGVPLFVEKGFGSKLYDADGNAYIDYVMGWGPLILGHANPEVIEALHKAFLKGSAFGAPTQQEVELARLLCEAVPSLEKVRLVNSGTEAAMTALRLARACTKREKVLKFQGCYHGHVDQMLVEAGSGALTHSVPDSAGLPSGTLETTRVVPYNDLSKVKALFEKEGETIACIMVEPVAANMGVIPPKPGFLEGLRDITKAYGSLLIFDEVLTGFRLSKGGAQEKYGITSDLTMLGKIIGGGLPIGAVGGRSDIMALLSPEGPVYQAGTLSGNSLSVAAGVATLNILSRKNVYETLEAKGIFLENLFKGEFKRKGIPGCVNRAGSLLSPFFGLGKAECFQNLKAMDKEMHKTFFHGSLEEGLYFPPSPFEAFFLSLSHSEEDLARTGEGVRKVFDTL